MVRTLKAVFFLLIAGMIAGGLDRNWAMSWLLETLIALFIAALIMRGATYASELLDRKTDAELARRYCHH